jgi:cobalt-zinc-cadmium efflux system outer membrane protein
MKTAVIGLVSLLWVGCAARAPTNLEFVERSDWQFTEPPPPEPEAVAAELRRKGELTLEDALRVADLSNPDLAAERKNIDLATAALWQAKLYPNPAFVYGFEEWSLSEGSSIGTMTAGVSTPLVVGGRIKAATSLAEADRDVAAIEYLGQRRSLLTDVKRAFFRVLAARNRVALAGETKDLARSLRNAANERFAAEAVPEMEVLKASVSLARAEADLRAAEKEAAVADKALLGLLGEAGWEGVHFVGDLRTEFPAAEFGSLRDRAEESHPVVLAAKKRKEAAEHGLELERAKRWQDWEFEILGGRGSAADFIVEGGIRIPLPLRDKNQAGIRRAEIRLVQANLELDAARNALVPRVAEAFHAFMAARDRVEILRSTILPKAHKALDQTREGYRVGKFEYLDLLDAQRTLAEARTSYTTAVAELNEAAATLEELSGTRLVRDPEEK